MKRGSLGLTYHKSIIDGVEIKRCRRTLQSYKQHVHHELSIGYIEEGTTQVVFDDETIDFTEGDGILIPPLTSHMCSPTDISNWQFMMLYIDPRYYKFNVSFDKVMKLTGEKLRHLKAFIQLLETEDDKELLENLLIELLVELGGPWSGSGTTAQGDEGNQVDGILEIRNWIVDRFTENLTLERLEETFDLNRFTIIRQFKRRYHTTPRAFQLQLKVAESKRMLAKGMDVFEIMEQVGFYDQAHFIREFKKMNGVTPAVYLQSL